MTSDLANGDELFQAIAEHANVEWRKYRLRVIQVSMKSGETLQEDHSSLPPFTTVRFRFEDPRFVSRLRSAVEGYKGNVAWHMFAHQRLTLPGTNWVIRPKFVDELLPEAQANGVHDVANYIRENYPDLSLQAYGDLKGLAECVRSVLGGQTTGSSE